MCVFLCVSVLLDTVAVPVGPVGSRNLVFERQGVGPDVHPVLFSLQVFVVALFFIVVLSLTVMWGGVAGQGRRRRYGGGPGVTEARGLRMTTGLSIRG